MKTTLDGGSVCVSLSVSVLVDSTYVSGSPEKAKEEHQVVDTLDPPKIFLFWFERLSSDLTK